MQGVRMVAVARVSDGFHARVLAARLGSEGIVTQLRGGGVDGPYPVGDIEVLVQLPDLDTAREILLADEVESAFTDMEGADEGERGSGRRRPAPWFVAVAVALVVLVAYLNTLAFSSSSSSSSGGERRSGEQRGEGSLVEATEGSAAVTAA